MSTLRNPNLQYVHAGLFRSERPWIHPDRTETTFEIIAVTDGEVFLREGDRDLHATKGQLILLEPGIRHVGSRETVGTEFYWAHFRTADGALPFARRFFDRFENVYLFKELLHWANLPEPCREAAEAVLAHILVELFYLSGRGEGTLDARAERIREWIRIHACAALTVKEVAYRFGFSPDHVSRLCKSSFGIGAAELINRSLLAAAKELLCNTDLYVKEVAARLGFSTDKAFIGYFRYHEGISPTEFRHRFGRLHMNAK
ncbi:MAG: helix-turn-helix transcriptional regulator [Clostridia bacterium]|nr:helix-turn-helix transcriptional regulator [Clostridia bacterium]